MMPGYDSWKTRSPDDDLGDEYDQPTPEQERADWEDEAQQCPSLSLAERIDSGLSSDSDGHFSPPLHRSEWLMIVAALRHAAPLRTALETILMLHDGNQPPALNMPDLDYARRTIRDIHFKARDALSRC